MNAIGMMLAGSIAHATVFAIAGVLAYLSTALLMRYFKQQEINALLPFAGYCVAIGVLTLLIGR